MIRVVPTPKLLRAMAVRRIEALGFKNWNHLMGMVHGMSLVHMVDITMALCLHPHASCDPQGHPHPGLKWLMLTIVAKTNRYLIGVSFHYIRFTW